MTGLPAACAALVGTGELAMPWLLPYRVCGSGVARDVAAGMPVAQALNLALQAQPIPMPGGRALRFVAQQDMPPGEAYEAFIARTACVPTRDNAHDLFNGLVWLRFAPLKRQLNALQSAQIASLGIGKSRGPARDAATIFDENAAILVVEDSNAGRALLEHLREHEWHAAFVEQRAMFGSTAEVWGVGHALMEKLVKPYKAITAHTWVVWAKSEFFTLEWEEKRAWLDAHVATQLQTHNLSTADYTPLPVLGIPDWWPDQDEVFYADASVFRVKRIK